MATVRDMIREAVQTQDARKAQGLADYLWNRHRVTYHDIRAMAERAGVDLDMWEELLGRADR